MSTACSRRSPTATASGRCSCIGSTATPRACCLSPNRARWPPTSARLFRARGARKIYWALVEGVPEAGERPHLAVSRQGRGDGRRARRAKGRSRRHRAHARRRARRPRRAAFAHPLRHRRQGRAAAWPGCRCARSPAAPINCAPIARRSAIPSSATPNTTAAPRTIPRAQRSVARRASGARAEAASAGAPADAAASARRHHRRDRAAAART